MPRTIRAARPLCTALLPILLTGYDQLTAMTGPSEMVSFRFARPVSCERRGPAYFNCVMRNHMSAPREANLECVGFDGQKRMVGRAPLRRQRLNARLRGRANSDLRVGLSTENCFGSHPWGAAFAGVKTTTASWRGGRALSRALRIYCSCAEVVAYSCRRFAASSGSNSQSSNERRSRIKSALNLIPGVRPCSSP